MAEVRINLNETIRFKPTKRAHEIYFNQLEEICKRYPVSTIRPHDINVDKDGYASMQLWEFMETFGPHTHIATPSICQPLEIVYDVQDEARLMTLKELIGSLRCQCRLVIRNEQDHEICEMDSNSSAVRFFADMEVLEWFPGVLPGLSANSTYIRILVKDDHAEKSEEEISCSEE